jgi:WD40 repeat protein
VRGLAISPDEKRIVTVADDGVVRIWDAGLGPGEANDFFGSSRLTGLVSHGENSVTYTSDRREPIASVAIAPDGTAMATAGHDGWIRQWRLDSEPEVRWSRHGQWVAALAAITDGERFISASEFAARVWSAQPLREVRRLGRHENDLTGTAVSRDGRVAIVADSEGTVVVLDGPDLQPRGRILHDAPAQRLVRATLSADGRLVATTSADRFVRVWRIDDSALVSEHQFDDLVVAFHLSPDGRSLAAATNTQVSVRRVDDWTEEVALSFETPVSVVAFDGAGQRLVVGTQDGTVAVHTLEDGEREWSGLHAGRVAAAHFSTDDRYLATGGYDRTARVWDARNGSERARHTFQFRIDAVQFLRGGTTLAAAGQNYVHVAPWRLPDVVDVACRMINGVDGPSRPRLLPGVSAVVCRQGEGQPPTDSSQRSP